MTNSGGTATVVNRYDEFGIPASTNGGRFGYTGQSWLPELGMNYYKARMYSPTLGRFMQSDPIGYGDGMNMYNYVGSDPVNKLDPTGLAGTVTCITVYYPSSSYLLGYAPATLSRQECTFTGEGPGSNLPPAPPSPPGPPGGVPQNVCSRPLSGAANRGQTVNSRRAQVRRELAQAMDLARRTGGDIAAAYNFEIGRAVRRLAPGGTWISGGTSKEDGNILFGAVTAELGIPLAGATGFGDVDEMIDDTLGLMGVRPYDGHWGPDSQAAKDQMAAGAGCPG